MIRLAVVGQSIVQELLGERMMAGGYTLDLYCIHMGEFPDAAGHPYGYFPKQFFGETFSACMKQAKQAGWRYTRTKEDVICPLCVAKGVK